MSDKNAKPTPGPMAHDPRNEANARLIAAAPDMLEALHTASGYMLNIKIGLETGDPKRKAVQLIADVLEIISAAIDRAGNA